MSPLHQEFGKKMAKIVLLIFIINKLVSFQFSIKYVVNIKLKRVSAVMKMREFRSS